jgi:hypothetical protein
MPRATATGLPRQSYRDRGTAIFNYRILGNTICGQRPAGDLPRYLSPPTPSVEFVGVTEVTLAQGINALGMTQINEIVESEQTRRPIPPRSCATSIGPRCKLDTRMPPKSRRQGRSNRNSSRMCHQLPWKM